MFDANQESFQDLKKILIEGTAPVYLWIGAGLSCDAGLPSWVQLKTRIIEKSRAWLRLQTELSDIRKRNDKLNVAEGESDLWKAFDRIYEAIGQSEYRKEILNEFEIALKCKVPFSYRSLLGIKNIKGVVTTNIDKITTRAYLETHNDSPVEFNGTQCGNYQYVLQGNRFFVLNLHGTTEDYGSWIMRKKDRDILFGNQGYAAFVGGLFLSGVVVFVGVDPTDVAVSSHLDKVRNVKQVPGTTAMYWITNDTTDNAFKFSNKYNISRIIYSSEDNHKELKEIVSLLNSGKSYDDAELAPAYVNLPTINKKVRAFNQIDLENLSDEDLREYLNKRAYEILKSGTQQSYKVYADFLNRYKKQIHQAWYVESGEKLLDLTLEAEIGEGAFGRVFRAVNSAGELFAVKVLKVDVMRKHEYLQSFRRGVRAMRILSEKEISGIVKFRSAMEIPASVVMELVDGENLHKIVQQNHLHGWNDKMRILTSVGKIIKEAHSLPERVLHRDIRPHNIMVRNDYGEGRKEVCVLDFDLAFHKDANEVSVPMGVGNGYTAPEQTDTVGRTGQSRSSRVDSYGLAMLCYFVLSGKDPVPRQCMMQGWNQTVDNDVASHRCENWFSLPYKMAEIIKICTNPEQNARWDLYQMSGYLDALNRALGNPDAVNMPELIADEILYRIAVPKKCQSNICTSNDGHKILSIPSGTSYIFGVQNRIINLEISWKDDGRLDFKRCKKTLTDRTNALVSKLRRQGFGHVEQHFDGNSATVAIQYETATYSIQGLTKLVGVLLEYDISPWT